MPARGAAASSALPGTSTGIYGGRGGPDQRCSACVRAWVSWRERELERGGAVLWEGQTACPARSPLKSCGGALGSQDFQNHPCTNSGIL